MELATCEIESIVNRWLGDIRLGGGAEPDSFIGKRWEPRWRPWCESIEIRTDDEIVAAHRENLSLRGVGFVCDKEIPPGTTVHIKCGGENTWIPVIIRHSTQTAGSYKTGAKFVKS